MVFGFHVHASANSQAHDHEHPHQERQVHQGGMEPGMAARHSIQSILDANDHPVLNNGQSIKHLATHRGYATAADGVRLFYEIYECPRRSTASCPAGSLSGGCPMNAKTASPEPKPAGQHGPAAAQSEVAANPTNPPTEEKAGAQVKTVASSTVADSSGPAVHAESAEGALQAAADASTSPACPVATFLDASGGAQRNGVVSPVRCDGGATGGAAVGRLEDQPAYPAAPGHAHGGGQSGGDVGGVAESDGVANVVLIMGFAAGRDGWLPLIHHWMSQEDSEVLHHLHARFCVFDNRGIGDSDSPRARQSYSTEIMAGDTLAVMDHLGWSRAHVVGFSMGGMVALKVAAAAPQRLLSLTALSVTGGGWQVIPTKWRALKLLLWAATARTPRQRAHADVHFHFSRDTLHAEVAVITDTSAAGGRSGKARLQRVEAALIEEYVTTSHTNAPQPHAGLMGQLHAVWMHSITTADEHRLRQLRVPVKVVHGYHDMMAMPEYGERIAKHVRAVFIMLNGGHFVVRECAPEVCMHLADSLVSATAHGQLCKTV